MTESEWLASDDPQAMLGYLQSPSDNANPNHIYPPSDRKLRLFACACCRLVWGLLPDRRSRAAVEASERFADGEIDSHQLVYAGKEAARALYTGNIEPVARIVCDEALNIRNFLGEPRRQWKCLPATHASLLRDIVGNPYRPVVLPPSPDRCKLCLGKGNVSAGPGAATMDRPARVPCERCHGRGWRTHPWLPPTVLSLAQAAYDERMPDGTLDPARLTILADALEEAGCTDEALLRHLRGWEWSPPEDHMGRDKGVWIRLRGPHVRGCWALDLILGKD